MKTLDQQQIGEVRIGRKALEALSGQDLYSLIAPVILGVESSASAYRPDGTLVTVSLRNGYVVVDTI